MKYQFLLLLIAILCGSATANAAAEKSDSVNVTTATAISNAKAASSDTKKNDQKTEKKKKTNDQTIENNVFQPSEKIYTEEGLLHHPFFGMPVSTESVKSEYSAIKNGEYLEYDVYLGVTRVGTAWLFCDGIVQIGTHTAYHILSGVRSSSFVEKIYKVNDRNDSWFDTQTLNSYGYYKELNEGHYFRNEWAVFDSRNHRYFGKKLNRKRELSSFEGVLEIPVSDILSAMYKVRAMKMKKGDKIFMDVNTKKNWSMEASVVRTEKIATVLGKKKCIVGEPKVGEEGIFVSKAGKRLFVWLTDDEEQIPVLMKAETFFGSVSAKLVKRELRY
ncbi:MAG: DUF3108 domain-containing protein [Elusimicrobiales bacterium]|nr:DUF3108 domain-containing protein [Elusimicrobiales bacterium]